MIVEYTIYNQISGQIIRTGSCPEDQFDIQAGDYSIVEGIYPDNKYYWDNGFIEIPPSPGDFYYFDYETKSWVYNLDNATQSALAKRDKFLRDGPDRISPLWWASMTQEQKDAWAQYRQDLLDITSQPDFPNVIIWPTPPQGA